MGCAVASSLATMRAAYNDDMRYLVRARLKSDCRQSLLEAITNGTLGAGSVAEGEYLRNMTDARLCPDETVRWVEVCLLPDAAARRTALLGGIFRPRQSAGCS